jgi:hypothetical protein
MYSYWTETATSGLYLGCNRVLHEKLIVAHLVKTLPTSYGTWRFITVFTRARHWSLSWASWILSTATGPIPLRSVSIFSHAHLGLPSAPFPLFHLRVPYSVEHGGMEIMITNCYHALYVRIWKETRMTCFKVMSRYSPGGTEENHEQRGFEPSTTTRTS